MSETLIQRIARHEGFRATPYVDTTGNWTVCYGHKLTPQQAKDCPVMTPVSGLSILTADIIAAKNAVDKALPWAASLDDVRKGVLIEMAFQLGINGLLAFRHFLTAMHAGDYGTAAKEMLNSLWHEQTPERCEELANLILNGN